MCVGGGGGSAPTPPAPPPAPNRPPEEIENAVDSEAVVRNKRRVGTKKLRRGKIAQAVTATTSGTGLTIK